MNIGDKPAYARSAVDGHNCPQDGLTFRERLIVAAVSNPSICYSIGNPGNNVKSITDTVDAVIAALEKEKQQ